MKKLSAILGIVLCLAMVLSMFPAVSATSNWTTVAIADVNASDMIAIVYTKAGVDYVMLNNANKGPLQVFDAASTAATADMLWNITADTNGYTIQPLDQTTKYLSVKNDNNGLQIADTACTWVVNTYKETNLYLVANDGTQDRVVGVYNTANFRSYKITPTGDSAPHSNLKDQTVTFYKWTGTKPTVTPPFDPTGKTQDEIIDAAYNLGAGESMAAKATLTGVISSIDNAWSDQFSNITVTINCAGKEDKPIQCFRLTGEGAKDLKIGDTITVTGTIKNFNGTVEFDAGCTLDNVVPGTPAPEPSVPETSVPEASQPEASEPEASQPEASQPEASQPEASQPEASEPEASQPEASQPEASQPEASQPEASQPEASQPEASQPEASEPEASEPTASSATIGFDSTANRTEFSETKQVWKQNGITVTNDKGDSTNNIINSSNPVRFYKNSKVTIAYTGMKSIVIDCNSASYATALKDAIPADSNYTVADNSDKVIVNFSTTVNSFAITLSVGQVRVDSITVFSVTIPVPSVPETSEPEASQPSGFDPTGKSQDEIIDAAYNLGTGESMTAKATLTGVISAVNTAWSDQYSNITVTIKCAGKEDKPIMCFRMKGDDAQSLKVGDTITVEGTIKNYDGTVEFDAGCELKSVTPGTGSEGFDPTGKSQDEIIDAAYNLGAGESMTAKVTLTGVISSIDTAWSDQYNNITVTITCAGKEDKPIMCFRLKGDGAQNLQVGDTITVTGILKNYVKNGVSIIQFDAGCTLDNVVPGTPAPGTSVPEPSVPEASQPEASQPEASQPEASQPEASQPEASQPEASQPEASQPEASQPEASEPEASEPEASEPEASEPEASEPEASQPEASEPEASEPEASEPEASQPDDKDQAAIIDAAYELEEGESMTTTVSLTGVIVSIDTDWSDQYGNITVTIRCAGREDKPIMCYRLKGEDAKNLKVGDTITVEGTLQNYYGTIEFGAGCVLVRLSNSDNTGATQTPTNDPDATGDTTATLGTVVMMVLSVTALAALVIGNKRKLF